MAVCGCLGLIRSSPKQPPASPGPHEVLFLRETNQSDCTGPWRGLQALEDKANSRAKARLQAEENKPLPVGL